jgi:hypothetical protein
MGPILASAPILTPCFSKIQFNIILVFEANPPLQMISHGNAPQDLITLESYYPYLYFKARHALKDSSQFQDR